jgi:ring-1,2-phenylacetyl-CoA epoxidase subunit PaaC
MSHEQQLAQYIIALADDELILGHRDSEWAGHAPILEEDIAFANLALDEIGHAVVLYETASELLDEDPETYPDKLAYFREAVDFRSTQFVELPRGDWAFSMLRQYLYDHYEAVRWAALSECSYQPLKEKAIKLRGEEGYHLRHTMLWVKRLGLGTEESNRRMQRALDELWPYAAQLFAPVIPAEQAINAAYALTPSADLRARWEERVLPQLAEANLTVPQAPPVSVTRREHTPYLTELLVEMQKVARLDPDAIW